MATIKKGTYRFNDKLTIPVFDVSIEYALPFIVKPKYTVDTQQNIIIFESGYFECVAISFDIGNDKDGSVDQFLLYRLNDTHSSNVYLFDEKLNNALPNDFSRWNFTAYFLEAFNIINASEVNGFGQIITVTEDTTYTDEDGIAFVTWFNSNTKVIVGYVTYNDTNIADLCVGQTVTLVCSDKTMMSDVVVTSNESGDVLVSYKKGTIAYISGEKTARLLCKHKSPTSDIIVIVEPKSSEGLEFKQSYDGSYYLNGLGTCTDTDIVVPMCAPEGNTVYRITSNVFKNNGTITSVYIPATVTTLDDDIFLGCTGLMSIGPTGSGASVEIPKSITIIPSCAFKGCTDLMSVVVPNSITDIESAAFSGCTGLVSIGPTGSGASVEIPNSVVSISNAFYNCTNLTNVVIPDGVTNIAYRAFEGCSNINTILFGENSKLESIGEFAFGGLSNLKSLTIPDGVTTIERLAFHYTGLQELSIPKNVTSIGAGPTYGCASLASITVDPSNEVYHSANNCIIHSSSKELIAGCMNSSIPNDGSVTKINQYAFYGCEGLTSIIIPASVTSIGYGAFTLCKNLSKVEFAENSELTSIGEHVFSNCKFSSIKIPNGVTTLASTVFNFCTNLRRILIPVSVTSIDGGAFQGCHPTAIYYTGSEEQWSQISIADSNWQWIDDATIYYNYDPDLF